MSLDLEIAQLTHRRPLSRGVVTQQDISDASMAE